MKYTEWLHEWLEYYIKPSAKEKTYRRYNEIAKQHLIPRLGEYEMSDISPLVVQRYITELLQSGNLKTGKGLAANSVNAIIAVVQNSLGMAHLLGLSQQYEMNKLKRPKVKERQISCFSVEEQKKIEKAVMSDQRDKMKGIVICLYTGLRIGELLALEWDDIDLKAAELKVSKSCHDGINEQGVFCRLTDSPKTESSNRVVPLPKQLLPMLKDMKRNRASNYVISSGQTLISVRSYQRSFELLLARLDIPHRGFHALRHTFATRALECGMDVKTLSEILGHKSPTVTLNRYVHSLLDHKRDMMNLVGKLL